VKDEDDPRPEYARSDHTVKEMFRSVDFSVRPTLGEESLQQNKSDVSEGIERVAEEARGERFPPSGDLPREVIPGPFHEAPDSSTEETHRHDVEPDWKQTTMEQRVPKPSPSARPATAFIERSGNLIAISALDAA
jgi:hypothetical protein